MIDAVLNNELLRYYTNVELFHQILLCILLVLLFIIIKKVLWKFKKYFANKIHSEPLWYNFNTSQRTLDD